MKRTKGTREKQPEVEALEEAEEMEEAQTTLKMMVEPQKPRSILTRCELTVAIDAKLLQTCQSVFHASSPTLATA